MGEKIMEDGWWEHYCVVEKDIMGFQKGVKCDWCGMEEPIKIVVRDDNDETEKHFKKRD